MSNCRSGTGGHAGTHVQDVFLSAIDAYMDWESGEPEPTVDFVTRPIPISRACGIVWNCSDILPSGAVDALDQCGIELNRRTYAAAARALSAAIKEQHVRHETWEAYFPPGDQRLRAG
jgi:hypothetical protein